VRTLEAIRDEAIEKGKPSQEIDRIENCFKRGKEFASSHSSTVFTSCGHYLSEGRTIGSEENCLEPWEHVCPLCRSAFHAVIPVFSERQKTFLTENVRSSQAVTLDKYLWGFLSQDSWQCTNSLSNKLELPNNEVTFLLGQCFPSVSAFMDTVKGVRVKDQQSGASSEEINRFGETGAIVVVESITEVVLESEFKGFAYTVKTFSKIYHQLYLQGRLHLLADQFPDVIVSSAIQANSFAFMVEGLKDYTRLFMLGLKDLQTLMGRDICFSYVQMAVRLVR
jgi:hypothetical protein